MDRGWFVEPTVFADVPNSAIIARQLPRARLVHAPYRAAEAVLGVVGNAHGFVIVAVGDDRQHRAEDFLARRVQTGTIGINGYIPSIGAPFGGIKASGLGRELAPETLAAYQQIKTTYVMGY